MNFLKSLSNSPQLRTASSAPVVCIAQKLSEPQDIFCIMQSLEHLLYLDVRVAIQTDRATAAFCELEVFTKKHPLRFALLDEREDAKHQTLLESSELLLFPSSLSPTHSPELKAGLNRDATLVLFADTVNRRKLAQLSEMVHNVFFFYKKTPEAFWDALSRAIDFHRKKAK